MLGSSEQLISVITSIRTKSIAEIVNADSIASFKLIGIGGEGLMGKPPESAQGFFPKFEGGCSILRTWGAAHLSPADDTPTKQLITFWVPRLLAENSG